MDKAGAYGIQSGAGPLIEAVEGNYDTVVGLPTTLLFSMLAQCGIRSTPLSEARVKEITNRS
jgi:septum formation protein